MKNPLVTVALMAYNRADYLPKAIECWLNQTYTNIELLVSNDASPDPHVEEICLSYAKKDKRIRYVKQEKNLGINGAFKEILKYANGELFMWAPEDDLWDKDFLKNCVEVHEKNPTCISAFSPMIDIDKNGNPIRIPMVSEYLHYMVSKYVPRKNTTYERLKMQLLNHFSDGKNQLMIGLWKKKYLSDNPLFGLHQKDDMGNGYWGNDNFFMFRNLCKGKIESSVPFQYFHRSHIFDNEKKARSLSNRIIISFYRRLEKLFSPYFWYIFRFIPTIKDLSFSQKVKLMFWNLFVMIRLFTTKKI